MHILSLSLGLIGFHFWDVYLTFETILVNNAFIGGCEFFDLYVENGGKPREIWCWW